MFAIVKTGGKQYKVSVGDAFVVERLVGEAGDNISLDFVLAAGEGENIKIGTPVVEGASVVCELSEQVRGPKVISFKKRRRQNSKRKKGHRQHLTILKVLEIKLGA